MFGMSATETLNLFTTISTLIMLIGVGYAVYFLATKKKRTNKALSATAQKCLGCGKYGEPNTTNSKFKSVYVCNSCQKDAENNAKLDNPDP